MTEIASYPITFEAHQQLVVEPELSPCLLAVEPEPWHGQELVGVSFMGGHLLLTKHAEEELTRRTLQVAVCIMSGLTNGQTATALDIVTATVKDKVRQIHDIRYGKASSIRGSSAGLADWMMYENGDQPWAQVTKPAQKQLFDRLQLNDRLSLIFDQTAMGESSGAIAELLECDEKHVLLQKRKIWGQLGIRELSTQRSQARDALVSLAYIFQRSGLVESEISE